MVLIFLHSFDGPVFSMEEKREIGKGEIGFHLLKAHSPSKVISFMEMWHKNAEI